MSYFARLKRMLYASLGSIALSASGVAAEDDPQLRPILVGNVKAEQLPDSVRVADIMRGDRRSWPDGTILTVVLPSRKHPLFDQVGKDFFAGKGAPLQRHWLRLVFSGRGNPPLYAESIEEMCELVQSNRGSCALFYDAVPTPCQSLPRSPRLDTSQ